MKPWVAMLMTALTLGACGAEPEPRVERAWVRLPAVAGRPGAAYFTVRAGNTALTLLAARTPAAIRTELHESMKDAAGMMTMAALPQVDVAAGGSAAFAPGGRHVMLFDVSPALKAGDVARLTLSFADGRTLSTDAKVVGAGDPPPS